MQYYKYVTEKYKNISPFIRKTPLLESAYFSRLTNNKIFFKCENLQYTNSFKVRGAFSKVISIKDKKNKKLISTSGGNHGLGVAFAANKFAMRAIIIVPEFVPQFRIDLIKALNAEVIVYGKTIEAANGKALEYIKKDPSYIYIHPFDDEEVIAGQATIAYELLKEMPDLDIIITSVGGGGLISGVSEYAKSLNPNIVIFGTQTLGADAMSQSLSVGKIITLPAITSIATSLGATKVAPRTFALVQKNVELVAVVSDDEALIELKNILAHEKLLVEPASSCNLAALRAYKFPEIKNKKIVIILCGGNVSLPQLKTFLID